MCLLLRHRLCNLDYERPVVTFRFCHQQHVFSVGGVAVPSPIHHDESMNSFRQFAIITLPCLIKSQIKPVRRTIWSVSLLQCLKSIKMLSHQVQRSHTLRPDFMGRRGGEVPQDSYDKGHAPSRVSWENPVPKMPCLFWLCAGNWCYNSLTANVQSPPHLLLCNTSFSGIIKSS